MKIFGRLLQRASIGVNSAPTPSRQIATPVTSTSSSAHPDAAIDPATFVRPSVGVSKTPKGAAGAATVFSVTPIGPAVFPAPVNASVIEPAGVAARPATNLTDTVSVADPLPDVGETTSHG